MREIGEHVRRRRPSAEQHTVRAAVYAHLDDKGERLFRKSGGRNGRYFVKR